LIYELFPIPLANARGSDSLTRGSDSLTRGFDSLTRGSDLLACLVSEPRALASGIGHRKFLIPFLPVNLLEKVLDWDFLLVKVL
jgi:hypothetical protein